MIYDDELYLDTEFNGFGGELISMALVSGRRNGEWYEAVEFCGDVDPWVATHVIPVLDRTPLERGIFIDSLHQFLRRFQSPMIVCDWHADAEHFCRMLAGKDYGTSLDFDCTIRILNASGGGFKSRVPHNALEDARALLTYVRGR